MSSATTTFTSTSANASTPAAGSESALEDNRTFFTLREDISALFEKPIKEMENRDLELKNRAKTLAEKERKVQQREQVVSDRERTLAEKERALVEREKKLGRDEKRAEEERKRHEVMKVRVAELSQKNDANAKEIRQLQQSLTQAESERDSLRSQGATREKHDAHPPHAGSAGEVHIHDERQDPNWQGGAYYQQYDEREEEETHPQPPFYPPVHSVPVPVPHMPYLPPHQQFRPHPYKYPPPGRGYPPPYPQPHPFYPVPPRVFPGPAMFPHPHHRHVEERQEPAEEEEGEAENHEWREQGYTPQANHNEEEQQERHPPAHFQNYPGQQYNPLWGADSSQ